MNPREELNKLWDEHPEHRTDIFESIMLVSGFQIVPQSKLVIAFMDEWNRSERGR